MRWIIRPTKTPAMASVTVMGMTRIPEARGEERWTDWK